MVGNAANRLFTVTVEDTTPPSLSVPDPIVAEATGPSGAAVTFTASAYDVVDGTLTPVCSPASGTTFALGTIPVNCSATDGHGNTTAGGFSVTVRDTTPPTISSLAASPSVLWPPNHRMVSVSLATSVSDACDESPTCQIVLVQSSEPENGLGDGDTAPDWVVTGKLTVDLRAERAGNGLGRGYTITVRCVDASGNSSTRTVRVSVPHNQ